MGIGIGNGNNWEHGEARRLNAFPEKQQERKKVEKGFSSYSKINYWPAILGGNS
jgi:hypothetical protein